MAKIQAQAGNSLADIYDVKGSIAGIETLETEQLSLVHELGKTVFSERFSTRVLRATTGAMLQNVTFDLVLTPASGVEAPPGIPARLLGVTALSDSGGRISTAAVMVREPVSGREVPVWAHLTADGRMAVRIRENDGAAAPLDLLIPDPAVVQLPAFIGGVEQPLFTNEVAMRGLTTGFGAGDVTIFFLLYIAFAEVGVVPSSRGLPIPSW